MDDRSNAILQLVVTGNTTEVLQYLKTYTITEQQLNTTDKNGRTCLSYAAGSGDSIMTDLLLATGLIEVNMADNDGNSPLIYAVSLGHRLVAMKLLRCPDIDVNQCNRNGFTALMKAAIHAHLPCLELLLQAGADVDMVDRTRSMTALQWAKLCGSQQCAKTLKKHRSQSRTLGKSTVKLSRSASDITNFSDSNNNSKQFFKKIRKSLIQHKPSEVKENHLGIEEIITCVSTPAIPVLLAFSNNNDVTSLTDSIISPNLQRKFRGKSMKNQQRGGYTEQLPPRIEITSETGEIIEPSKQVYSSSITKRHQQIACDQRTATVV